MHVRGAGAGQDVDGAGDVQEFLRALPRGLGRFVRFDEDVTATGQAVLDLNTGASAPMIDTSNDLMHFKPPIHQNVIRNVFFYLFQPVTLKRFYAEMLLFKLKKPIQWF